MRATTQRVLVPVVLVAAGLAFGQLLRPGLAQAPAAGPLASAVVRAKEAVPTHGEWGGWLRYFRGDTHGTKDMVVLKVSLKPGQAPHPPHRHAEEEIMILAEGSGTWHLDGKDSPARAGDVLYAAPWSMHGVKNTGDAPLAYYMVKYGGKGVTAPEAPADNAANETTAPR